MQLSEPEAEHHARVNLLVEIYGKVYERATAYTNAVLIVGYAGIFAIWTFARDQLSDGIEAWVAVLTGFSLLAFVVFEVVKMLMLGSSGRKLSGIIRAKMEAQEFGDALEAYNKGQHLAQIRFMRFWVFTLVATVIPGLLAAGLLFYGIGRTLPLRALWPS